MKKNNMGLYNSPHTKNQFEIDQRPYLKHETLKFQKTSQE